MDEFEQRSREAARAILERHGWNRPMTAELKEMREVVDLPYTECKRYLVDEWQDMRVPLLEKENAELRVLVRDLWHELDAATQYEAGGSRGIVFEFADAMRKLGIEVDA